LGTRQGCLSSLEIQATTYGEELQLQGTCRKVVHKGCKDSNIGTQGKAKNDSIHHIWSIVIQYIVDGVFIQV